MHISQSCDKPTVRKYSYREKI